MQFNLRTTEHTLGPEATAAGGVGITKTVGGVVGKSLAMAAVHAGRKVEVIKLAPESPVFIAVPNLSNAVFPDAAKGAVIYLAAHIAHVCVAVVQQSHAGADLAVTAHKAHALAHKLAVGRLSQHALAVEIEVEILLLHKRPDALGRFRDVHIEEGQMHRGQDTVLAGAGVHVHKAGVEHLALRGLVRGGDV